MQASPQPRGPIAPAGFCLILAERTTQPHFLDRVAGVEQGEARRFFRAADQNAGVQVLAMPVPARLETLAQFIGGVAHACSGHAACSCLYPNSASTLAGARHPGWPGDGPSGRQDPNLWKSWTSPRQSVPGGLPAPAHSSTNGQSASQLVRLRGFDFASSTLRPYSLAAQISRSIPPIFNDGRASTIGRDAFATFTIPPAGNAFANLVQSSSEGRLFARARVSGVSSDVSNVVSPATVAGWCGQVGRLVRTGWPVG